MNVSAETKLKKHLTSSYKSFGSSSELTDGSSDGLTKKHVEGDQLQGKQKRYFVCLTKMTKITGMRINFIS